MRSIKRFAESEDCEKQESRAESGHRRHLRPEDIHADALEVCAPEDNQEISQRAGVGHVLEPLGHGADGKSESGEYDRGHNEEEGSHHGLLLG